jgi:hypothetical protein
MIVKQVVAEPKQRPEATKQPSKVTILGQGFEGLRPDKFEFQGLQGLR